MTPQEMFDTVARHLLTQKAKSEIADPSAPPGSYETLCRYRDCGGRKCGIGALIPDDKYTPEMEGRDIYGLVREFPFLREYVPNQILGRDLQMVHDMNDPEVWRDRLAALAASHSLSTDVLKEFGHQ